MELLFRLKREPNETARIKGKAKFVYHPRCYFFLDIHI